jgi:erythromycin esterase-like protein
MADTLDALVRHLALRNRETKVVVWAHNSHLGDARATQMGRSGECSVGQLVREHYCGECMVSDQFDAIIHFDQTRIEPLEPTVEWNAEPAETFPFGV